MPYKDEDTRLAKAYAALTDMAPVNVQIQLYDRSSAVVAGSGAGYMLIPPALNGRTLNYANATVFQSGSSGFTYIQIARVRPWPTGAVVNMLTTGLYIDPLLSRSDLAVTGYAISGANAQVKTMDMLRFDILNAHAVAATGLVLLLGFI